MYIQGLCQSYTLLLAKCRYIKGISIFGRQKLAFPFRTINVEEDFPFNNLTVIVEERKYE